MNKLTEQAVTGVWLCFGVLGVALGGSVYKCTNSGGSVTYQQSPCPDGSSQEEPRIRDEGARATIDPGSTMLAKPLTAAPPAQHRNGPSSVSGPSLDATVLLLPNAWDRKSPLPVAIWLHGYRANPFDLTASSHYQTAADALGIAIVGVPATNEENPSAFYWANDTRLDGERVEQALQEAARRSGVAFGRRMLFGFSQGAVVALELAARFPSRFSGAIALSPGGKLYSPPVTAKSSHGQQTYYISIGAGELEHRVAVAREYERVLRALGANVHYREIAGMNDHALPADWPERLREWAAQILALRE